MTSSLPYGNSLKVTPSTCYGPSDHLIWLNIPTTYLSILPHHADVSYHCTLSDPTICDMCPCVLLEEREKDLSTFGFAMKSFANYLSPFPTIFNTIGSSPMSHLLKSFSCSEVMILWSLICSTVMLRCANIFGPLIYNCRYGWCSDVVIIDISRPLVCDLW